MRAFLAIDLPAEVKTQLGIRAARLAAGGGKPGYSFTQPANLHLTLRFLGEVVEGQLPSIEDALRVACAGTGALSLRLGGLGAFPRIHRPEIVWVGLACLAGDLVGVQQRIEAAVRACGFAPETRPFAAHVTLARQRDRAAGPRMVGLLANEAALLAHEAALLANEAVPVGNAFTAAAVQLFSSELRPGRPPVYRVLKEFPLC